MKLKLSPKVRRRALWIFYGGAATLLLFIPEIGLPLLVLGLITRWLFGFPRPSKRRWSTPTSLNTFFIWCFLSYMLGGLSLGAVQAVFPFQGSVEILWGILGGAVAMPLWRGWRIVKRWRKALEARPIGRARRRGLNMALEISAPLNHGARFMGHAGLGDPAFDKRWRFELSLAHFAYLTPARRAYLTQNYERFKLKQREGHLTIPLYFFKGSAKAIQAAIRELSLLVVTDAEAALGLEARLLKVLRDEEDQPSVALNSLHFLAPGPRAEALEGLWRRLDDPARLELAQGLHDPTWRAWMTRLLEDPAASSSVRAEALDGLAGGWPLEDHLRWLRDTPEVRAAALSHLVAQGFCLTPEGLLWFSEGALITQRLESTLLDMAEQGWHPPLARYVRGRLKSPRKEARRRAIDLLGRSDDDAAALSAALESASLADRRLIQRAIAQIRERNPDGAGALTLSEAEGELSLTAEAGGLSHK